MSEITWVDVTSELPDDEMAVLMARGDGEVWIGFRDGGAWYWDDALPAEVDGAAGIKFWAHLPAAPEVLQ
jgi:hypothetical protein